MRPERWFKKLSFWLRLLLHRPELDQELDDEIGYHLDAKAEENIANGMLPEEARRAARIELGGVEQAKENMRSVRTGAWLETFLQDIRFGLRMLQRSLGFTTVAVLTLAVGLAANTAIFSVINGVLLQPLEYPNSSQLVALQLLVPQWAHKFPMVPLNPATYLAWSRQANALAGIGVAETGDTVNLTGAGEPELLAADAVTPTLFDVLGVKPLLGRTFSPDADQTGHNHEAVLTNSLWRNRFNGDPSIIGHAIALNGSPYTVVGILPVSFDFPTQEEVNPIEGTTPKADIFVPEVFEKEDLAPDTAFGLATIARLKPGVSQAEAAAELNVILSREFSAIAPISRAKTIMMPLAT